MKNITQDEYLKAKEIVRFYEKNNHENFDIYNFARLEFDNYDKSDSRYSILEVGEKYEIVKFKYSKYSIEPRSFIIKTSKGNREYKMESPYRNWKFEL